MFAAFWYLMRCSSRNRLIHQLDRLRQPRYAIALLVGIIYVWFFLFQQRRPGPPPSRTIFTSLIPLLGSLGILVAVTRWWVFGGNTRALAFTLAEIQFLFPAPVSRRTLLQWKLLRSQIVILLNVLIWIVIAQRAAPPIPVVFYGISLWLLLSTLSLHRLGAALARAGLDTRWRMVLRAQALPMTLVVAILVTLGVTLTRRWPTLSGLCCGELFWTGLGEALSEPAAGVALLPFRLVLAPVSAGTINQWASGMIPALAILAIHYAWVMRSQIAFEEAALQSSAEMASRLAAARRKPAPAAARARFTPSRAWVRLSPRGWAGGAILWKNLLLVTRGILTRRMIPGFILAVVAIVAIVNSEGKFGFRTLAGSVALATAGFLALVGPSWIRNDLRQDLPHLSLLRSFPLSGRTVVLAEILSSTVTLTALQMGFLLGGIVALGGAPELADLPSRTSVFIAAPFALIILNTIGITVQNGGALLFPEWVRFDAVRPGGLETLGQNLLSALFTMMLTLLGLVLPVVAGGLTWALVGKDLETWGTAVAFVAALLVAAVQMWVLVTWLGRVFDRLDPSV